MPRGLETCVNISMEYIVFIFNTNCLLFTERTVLQKEIIYENKHCKKWKQWRSIDFFFLFLPILFRLFWLSRCAACSFRRLGCLRFLQWKQQQKHRFTFLLLREFNQRIQMRFDTLRRGGGGGLWIEHTLAIEDSNIGSGIHVPVVEKHCRSVGGFTFGDHHR